MKFHAGDFSLDTNPQLGRQVEIDSNQIEKLIESNQHYNMWEIANIFKISKSIKSLVKMKNVSFILQNNPYGFLDNPIVPTKFFVVP